MAEELKRCTRCILPETYPHIDFDEDGVCRVCREFDRKYADIDWDARKARLERILDRYRGKGGKWDCMVPFSGGKDSTYTLWLLKNVYGMNPLAFNFDNGFADPEAVLFVRRTAQKLGVDLVTYAPDRELLYRVYRRALEATGEFCAACIVLIPTAIFRYADIHGIRLIAAGFSDVLEAPPPETSYIDRKLFRNIMKGHISLKEMRWDYFFPSWKRMFGVKMVNVPNYMEWDLPEIYRTLQEELGYEKDMSQIRYDCLATPHSSYLFRCRTGFGKYEYLYANMVRAGVIDREEALRIVREREAWNKPKGFDEFICGLGADPEEVMEDLEDKTVFNFKGRNRTLRRLAIKVREMLP
jgi:N-acetyl sugar amidotransferase